MGPLAGLRIVEFAGLAPSPFAAMMLADMGADVIRIERPGGLESNEGIAVNPLNRNRPWIELDLKAPEDIETVWSLIGRADGLIESYRPGVMERLGTGPDDCLAVNPRLVYGRMTGWGQDGPLAQSAGHDLNYVGLTGALHSIGRPGQPPDVPLNLVGDFGGGGMLLAFGMVCGLHHARSTGEGQVVDAAMVDGVSSLMAYAFGLRASGLWSDERGENVIDGGAPYYAVYETLDQRYVTVAAAEKKFFAELLDRLDIDPDTVSKQHDRDGWPALRERLESTFRLRTLAEWGVVFDGSDACVAPVLMMPEALAHDHQVARNSYVDVDGVPQPAPAPRFGRSRPQEPSGPRPIGIDEHARAVWGLIEGELQPPRHQP